jgi:17beta-estradiol 17-dehydrogenase / very-long-chain 3-oxoacyl-CoA reductase
MDNEAISQASEWPTPIALLLGLGALSLARLAFQIASVLFQTFFLPGINLKKFGAPEGAWAVITGASDGIGKEFSFQLAEVGFNVLLVARNKATLESVASEIQNKYPRVSARVHSIDFATHHDMAYSALSATLKDLNIGVLVNNVGKSHAMPTYFVDTPQDELNDIVTVNVNATLRVTYAVLPGMVDRKRGLILNVGSFAGAVPSPMLAVYSGTKAFLATFSAALGAEVKQHNIVVEHLNTYFVVSKLSKIRKASAMVPTPKAFVRSVLSKVGLPCGAAFSGRPNTSTPYWSHALLDYGITLIGIPSLFISYTHGLHRSIRKRALRKMERESKAE